MENVYLSIIVPVFNAEQYLCRCLDSLCAQTLKNAEFICVDDSSTDNSLTILRQYAQKDERIVVMALDANLGPAGSRNVALRRATGQYIGFVDSDDYVDLDFYNKLCTGAVQSGADIVKGNMRMIVDGIATKQSNNNHNVRLNKYHFLSHFWTAIYSNEMLKKFDIEFPQAIRCGVDIPFLFQAVSRARTVYAVDDTYYNYCRRNDSTDSDILNMDKIYAKIYAAHFMIDYLNTLDIEDDNYFRVFNNRLQYLCSLGKRVAQRDLSAVSRQLADTVVQLYAKSKYKAFPYPGIPVEFQKFLHEGDIESIAGYIENLSATKAGSTQANVLRSLIKARLKSNASN